MWVRGLKPRKMPYTSNRVLSHPMWVRGLKLYYSLKLFRGKRRTLCGCVD